MQQTDVSTWPRSQLDGYGCMHGWMHACMDGWMDGYKGGEMKG